MFMPKVFRYIGTGALGLAVSFITTTAMASFRSKEIFTRRGNLLYGHVREFEEP